MAMGIRFNCSKCKFWVEAWDEGNPYYFDSHGKKQYVYHPSRERMLCEGNDRPNLCLACSKRFMVDSAAPVLQCPKCKSVDISDTFRLARKKCPKCKQGIFKKDPDVFMIS